MKLKTNKDLAAELIRASRLTLKTRIPALSNVLLRAKEGTLEILSTNLDQGLNLQVSAEVEEEGELCISAKQLGAIVKSCSNEIEISSDNNDAIIESGRFRATINGLNPREFSISELTEEQTIEIPGKDLAQAISQVIFAASADETRYILNGVFIEWEKGTMRLVATDGRQLAFFDLAIESNCDDLPNFILPTLGTDLMHSIAENSETVTIGIGSSHIRVTGESEMWSKVIEGKFPDYRQVIPNLDTLSKIAILPRESLMLALRRISLVINPAIPIATITGSGEGITIEARSSESTGKESLDCGTDPFEISINPVYFQKMLASTSVESVTARVENETSPMLVQADDLQYVLMPMRKA